MFEIQVIKKKKTKKISSLTQAHNIYFLVILNKNFHGSRFFYDLGENLGYFINSSTIEYV
jgi:hypothetical protein